MKPEICFFVQEPVSTRDHQRFGYELLTGRGFKVTFLDLSRLLNPGYPFAEYPADSRLKDSIIAIKKEEEAEEYFRQHPGAIGVDLIGAQPNNLFLYRAMKQFKVTFASFCANSLPQPSTSLRRRLNILIRGAIAWLRMRGQIAALQRPAYVLVGGSKYQPKQPAPNNKTRLIQAHTLDYDLFLGQRSPVEISGRYAVFLDEYYPFHPDFIIGDKKSPTVDPEEYYQGLNQLFAAAEDQLGLKIVIAAHPRSRYDLQPEYFGPRRVIMGRTIDLVAQADLVLAHSSTAVNYAVLYHKPIVFIASRQIAALKMDGLIKAMAGMLGKTPVWTEEQKNIKWNEELLVDRVKYAGYKEAYIKVPGTPDKLFWDIVADRLLEDRKN